MFYIYAYFCKFKVNPGKTYNVLGIGVNNVKSAPAKCAEDYDSFIHDKY